MLTDASTDPLNAQRTFNDVRTAYYEALFNRAAALAILEKSAGAGILVFEVYCNYLAF